MTILPMLACPTSSASNRKPVIFEELMARGDWVADVKIDGVRALPQWDGQKLIITNRVGADITHRYPEIQDALSDVLRGQKPLVLDGEIVARDGKFESTLMRDQQENPRRIATMIEKYPVIFVGFDMPDFSARWSERRRNLDEVSSDWQKHAGTLATTITSFSVGFLNETREHGMEGVVAKHINSRYEYGKRSRQWLKFRNRYRVSCLVAGYYPGTGSRAEFGGLELALLDDAGNPVSVGRVGTGFTGAEIVRLKTAIDRSDLLVVEIETTNQTSGGQLRFPVYRGVRTDVAQTDCSVGQLQFLPTC